MSLADRVTHAVANPLTTDEFDPHAELAAVLAGIGMTPADTGGEITFVGADPVVPSTLRLGGAAAIALVAKSAAMAKLWRLRGGDGQDISVDLRVTPHRLCPFYDRRWERLNGHVPVSAANPGNAFGFGFYRTADDRWVMPLNPYPKIKVAAQKLLDVPDDAERVAQAVSTWDARELEAAAIEAGVVLPMLRSTDEFLAENTGITDLPLIEITRIGDSEPEPLAGGDPLRTEQPLAGIRALGMGHVIAGAGAGRALALHGADVLNLWRVTEFEHDVTYLTANVGTRSATIDPYQDRALVTDLVRGADVF
jgi:crotonobetainyl-CoA:carnitine CoA-transferase CaiB-like acyl-CoA transferase